MRIIGAIILTLFLVADCLAGGYDAAVQSKGSHATAGSYYPATVATETVQVEVPVQVQTRVVQVPVVQQVAAVAVAPVAVAAYVEPTLYREARPGEIRRARRRGAPLLAVPGASLAVATGGAPGVYLSGVAD